MIITNKALPRRTFLRGAGRHHGPARARLDVSPLTAAARTTKQSPVRLGYVYTPNGIIGCMRQEPAQFMWTPKPGGANFEFSPTMKSLEPFRDEPRRVQRAGAGRRAARWAMARATTRARRRRSSPASIRTRPAAPTSSWVSRPTRSPRRSSASTRSSHRSSSALEPQPLAGNCDSGYTCAYMSMSWRARNQPAARRDQSARGVRTAVRRRREHRSGRRGWRGSRARRACSTT